jgi:predicted phage-related endonuclease
VKKYKEKLFPTVVQDSTEPFLAASLDAINKKSNQIYEIKCGLKTYEKVSASKNVPSYYVAQVQHMLMITQMESLIFAVYRPNETLITLEVFRNDVYIRNLRRKEKDLYGRCRKSRFQGLSTGYSKTVSIIEERELQGSISNF